MQPDLNRISFEANPPFGLQNPDPPLARTRQIPWSAFDVRGALSMTSDIGSLARLYAISGTPITPLGYELMITPCQPTTVDQLQAATAQKATPGYSVWDILDSLTGTLEAPADWAAEHDYYLYGTPKQH